MGLMPAAVVKARAAADAVSLASVVVARLVAADWLAASRVGLRVMASASMAWISSLVAKAGGSAWRRVGAMHMA